MTELVDASCLESKLQRICNFKEIAQVQANVGSNPTLITI